MPPVAGEPKGTDSQARNSGETETTTTATDNASADDEPILVQGRVLDAAGQPVPAATVRLVRWYFSHAIERKPLAEAQSDGEGRFQISYRKSQFNVDVKRENQWKEVVVSAFKPGFGPDWASCDELAPGEAAELRLSSDDLPITGRVLDLEGRPLAGVRVGVGTFQSPKAADLSEWIEAVKQGEPPWTAHTKMRDSGLPFEGTGLPSELVTDERGSFRLSGMGRERAIYLTFEGPTIVRTGVTAVTRKMAPLSLRRNTRKDSNDKLPVLGADFEIALPPTRAIEGVVTDAATGEPLAGVGVQSWRFAGSTFIGERQIRTTTDEQGRFRLVGMPKGKKNEILAVPVDDQPYFMHVSEVPDEPGLEPVAMKVELHRGIWITGRVTNLATGKPVAMAQLYFLPFLDNDFARATPEFGSHSSVDGTNAYQDRYQTAADGTFRLVGLPGRSIVGVLGTGEAYRQALGASDIKGMDAESRFKTYHNPIQPSKKWPTAMKEIAPPKDATSVEVNFQLDPGQQVEITTLDPAGQPIAGVHVTGVTPRDYRRPIDSATIVAVAFGPDEERTILFHHDQRRLGKVIRTGAGDPPPKITVQLEPCATIKGRLVDENQVPVSGAEIRFDVRPSQDFSRRLPATTTDSDGRFENAAVLPGVDYAVMSESAKSGFVTLADKVPIEPGETVDLGTIDVTTKVRPAPTRVKAVAAAGVAGVAEAEKSAGTIATATSTTAAAASEATSEKTARNYEGQVVDPAGKPVAGAHVAAIGMKIESSRGGDLSPNGEILAQGVTDENGHFHLSGHLVSSKTHHYANLVARKDGLAIGWQPINLDANVTDAKLALATEEPIRGRLIDIEGQPAAGVRLAVRSLMKRGANGSLSAGGVGFQGDDVPAAWLQAVTSDSEGRFTLGGIPTEHGLLLDVAGGERFAPQSISLNTGMPEQRGERDATYRPIVKNVSPGEEAVLALRLRSFSKA